MKNRVITAVVEFALLFALLPMPSALAGSTPEVFGTTRTSVADGATYTISTENELAHLATIVNGGEDCKGNFFVLTNDITISSDHDGTSGGNWTPIGYGAFTTPFSGSLYGQNHTISGLDLQVNTYSGSGLLGFVGSAGAVVDLAVTGSMTIGVGKGGIVGVNEGIILNCSSDVTYTNGIAVTSTDIGGIAGMNSGIIQNCTNIGDISSYDARVGGITGSCNAGASVINCRNMGNISGGSNTGGIVGRTNPSSQEIILNCTNTGNISGTVYCGGIVGSLNNTSTLANCYSTGTISAVSSADAGSITGTVGSGATVDNCYWLDGTYADGCGTTSGTVSNAVPFTGTDTLSSAVGGTTSLLTALNDYVTAHPSSALRSWVGPSAPQLTGTVTLSSPADSYEKEEDTADFTALAAGDSLTYQWQVLTTQAGAVWTDVSDGYGSTTPTYTTPAMTKSMDSYQYRCIFSGGVHSAPATLKVATMPKITVQPADCVAADGGTMEFSVTATGGPAPTYEWYVSMDNGTSWMGMSSDSNVFSLTPMEPEYDGFLFYCKVSNPVGSVDSDIVGAYLPVTPVITDDPKDASAAQGNTATFTVTATGKPAPTYQWQSSEDGTTWSDVTTGTGKTAASYTTEAVTTAMNGRRYRCVVTNGGGSATSHAAKLTVSAIQPPSLSGPEDASAAEGKSATFTVVASGGSGVSYRWQVSADGLAWNDVSKGTGGLTASYTTEPVSSGMNGQLYRCVAANCGGSAISRATKLSVLLLPAVSGPQDANAAIGETATFTVTVPEGSGLTYRWQVSTDGAAWNDVTNGAAASYTTEAVTSAMNGQLYRCVVTNSAGSVPSRAAKLNVLFLSPSVSEGKIYTNGRITITPSIPGGVWSFDDKLLSRDGNTFTGLVSGTARIGYTVGGHTTYTDVTIRAAALPYTGQDFTWPLALAVLAVLAGAAASAYLMNHRRRISAKQAAVTSAYRGRAGHRR